MKNWFGDSRFRSKSWNLLTALIFIAPIVTLSLIFEYIPMVRSGLLAFYDWNMVQGEPRFVGMQNFAVVAGDSRFHIALRNTLVYVAALLPLQMFLPLLMALTLQPLRRNRLTTTYRVLLFLPTVISLPAAAVVWLWMFHPLQGVLNQILVLLGGDRVNWLGEPAVAIGAIILVATWSSLGFNMLLYLAALEAVPRDIRDAAALDGARGWSLFRHIEWPLISPTFFFIMVTTVLFVNNEAFAVINILTGGGPFSQTSNILFYLYERAFRFFQIGEASALALGLVLLYLLLTWAQFRFAEGRVHYG